MIVLKAAWDKRNKLCAEGDKLFAEGNKLRVEGYKLTAESYKLWAEGYKLRAEGDKLYCEAVIDLFGPKATIKWSNGSIRSKERVCIPFSEVLYV